MEVLQHTDKEAMRAFVDRHAHEDATVYTDGASAYIGDRVNHETVAHTPGDYVSGRCPHERDRGRSGRRQRTHKGTFRWWRALHDGQDGLHRDLAGRETADARHRGVKAELMETCAYLHDDDNFFVIFPAMVQVDTIFTGGDRDGWRCARAA